MTARSIESRSVYELASRFSIAAIVSATALAVAGRSAGSWAIIRITSDRGQHRHHRRAGEGQPIGKQFIEHHAEPEEIGAGIHGTVADPFGRHVGRRAHYRAVHRHVGLGRIVTQITDKPEVDDLHLPRRTLEDDVLGFDVAVDEAPAMSRREPLGDLASDPEGLRQRHGAHRGTVFGERVAVEALHNNEGQTSPVATLTVLAHLMDRDHVRVLDGGGRPALADEPLT